MKLHQAKQIVDEVWPYLDSIGLTGLGETLLYHDIEEIVDYIQSKNKGIILSFSTNALAPNFIEKSMELIDKIDTIQVSIDGLNSVYESIRINANFNEFHYNLKHFRIIVKIQKRLFF